VSVTTPKPPQIDQRELEELVGELQALIEEARRRARRRRRLVAAVVIATLLAGAAALFHGGGDGTTLARSTAEASPRQSAPGLSTSSWSAATGPDGAFVTAFAALPNALYAGTIGSGAFKSTDRGRTWHALRGGLPAALRVDALAGVSSKLYAGTSLGVFESTNAGRSWQLANRGLFKEQFPDSRTHRLIEGYISGLAIDPSRPRTLYAAGGRLYRSDDAGGTWHALRLGTDAPFVGVPALTPADPSLALVRVSGPSGAGVLRSHDGGRTWQALGLHLTRYDSSQVAIDPRNPRVFYVASTSRGLLKSSDGGASWRRVHPGRALSFALDPVAAGTLYLLSDDGLSKSTDGGSSWEAVPLDLRNEEAAWSLWAGTSGTVYAATAGRLLQSLDGGASWRESINGLRAPRVTDLATGRGAVYAATSGSALYRSADAGATWHVLEPSATVGSVAVDPTLPHTVFAASDRSGVYRSDDDGRTWRALPGLAARRVLALAGDAKRDTIYAGAAAGLFTSSDHGASWQQTALAEQTTALAVGADVAYAGTSEGGAWRSDAGGTWLRQGHVCCGRIRALAVDPSSPEVVYAGNSYGAFRSVDGGATWKRAGLSRLIVEAIAVDPVDPRTLYAATAGGAGVYRSTDAGSTWKPFGKGLPAGAHGGLSMTGGVGSLALSPDGRQLYAGTLGSGVVARALPR
jgi:photosystem II stability/assembly factor-like uncharacterized protein